MKDWRADNINACTAYFTKRLRRSDYNVINNYFWAHFFVVVLTVCVTVAADGSLGLPVGAAVLHFMWLIMALSGNLNTARKMHFGERIMVIMAYLIIYATGIVYLIAHWDFSLYKDKKVNFFSELSEKDKYLTSATYFCVGYIVFLPWFSSTYCAYLKIQDDVADNILTLTGKILLGIAIFHTLALLVCVKMFMSLILGILILVVFIFATYLIVLYFVYKKNDYTLPTVW